MFDLGAVVANLLLGVLDAWSTAAVCGRGTWCRKLVSHGFVDNASASSSAAPLWSFLSLVFVCHCGLLGLMGRLGPLRGVCSLPVSGRNGKGVKGRKLFVVGRSHSWKTPALAMPVVVVVVEEELVPLSRSATVQSLAAPW